MVGVGWIVYVLVSLQIFCDVLVIMWLLLCGDGVMVGDVYSELCDIIWFGYGYIDDLGQFSGCMLVCLFGFGSVLMFLVLGGCEMVWVGDYVQVVVQLDGIEVCVSGIVLGSGDNGVCLWVCNEVFGCVVDVMVNVFGVVWVLF